MKKKIIYAFLTCTLVIMGSILLTSMTKKNAKPKKNSFGTSFSIVNHTSTPWTNIKIGSNNYAPSQMPCTCYPTTDDFTVIVTFSSAVTGAIQIVDSNLNPLACSPSGVGATRTLVHCLGSTTTAKLDIYTSQGCP